VLGQRRKSNPLASSECVALTYLLIFYAVLPAFRAKQLSDFLRVCNSKRPKAHETEKRCDDEFFICCALQCSDRLLL